MGVWEYFPPRPPSPHTPVLRFGPETPNPHLKMTLALFYHSLISDWNHGNAHFLRGVASELGARGHDVRIFEPRDAWGIRNLLEERGEAPIAAFHEAYPQLGSTRYDLEALDLDEALAGVDLAVVHEWNDPALVERIGAHRRRHDTYRLLFHDTHHRAATRPQEIADYELSHYDGVLAFGRIIRDRYLDEGWAARAWTWHEAADTRAFRPIEGVAPEGDVVWIGNWGDEERTEEIEEFLIEPVRDLGLNARVHGVRYPEAAREELAEAGIDYAGWVPNYRVPDVFARFKVTLHIPRRPYAEALPGIPTIRPFEALACGIPLVCAPWEDAEGLFTPGEDYLVARDAVEMKRHLRTLLNDPARARILAARGRRTVLQHHTCAHRVDELMTICEELGLRNEDRRSRIGDRVVV